jgi:hypothetical protein
MLATTLALVAEEELSPIFMPPIAFAGIAAAIFILLALVTFSYRDVANRHADKLSDDADAGHGHH